MKIVSEEVDGLFKEIDACVVVIALMAASFECEPAETEHDREQLRSLR